jgi:hypothetical protein
MRPSEILREDKCGHDMPCPYSACKKQSSVGALHFVIPGMSMSVVKYFVMKFYHLFSFAHFRSIFCLSNSAKYIPKKTVCLCFMLCLLGYQAVFMLRCFSVVLFLPGIASPFINGTTGV